MVTHSGPIEGGAGGVVAPDKASEGHRHNDQHNDKQAGLILRPQFVKDEECQSQASLG
jgi:hypothetical protein